jgi:hypothetical protein
LVDFASRLIIELEFSKFVCYVIYNNFRDIVLNLSVFEKCKTMNEESPLCKIGEDFEIKEFVDINTASANRTRWLTLVLIVATVLIFIGFFNSMNVSWARYRINALKKFENLPENNVQIKSQEKPLLDPYFGVNDFRDNGNYKGYGFKQFACKFRQAPNDLNSISHYIFISLNNRTKQLLDECSTENSPSRYFVEAVQGDLDRVLNDRFLYNSVRFPILLNIERKDETKRLLAISSEKLDSILNLEEKYLIRMNRLLLEETYKNEILESKIHIPSNEKIIAKEIPARIAYDDNVMFIKIPVFGIAIDVNDLGFIGGISIFIILCLLRFGISREIKNLNISFKEAFQHNKLCKFYHSLAMHQVLTVPNMEGETTNKQLVILSKLVYLMPVVVLCFGVGYDFYSIFRLFLFPWSEVQTQILIQLITLVFVIVISLRCLERQLHIDRIWGQYYYILRDNPATLKLKYSSELEKIKSGCYDNRLVEIYEYQFLNPSNKNPFWLVTLYHISINNLREFGRWILKLIPTSKKKD